MLTYVKMILQKVSFDHKLFEKELQKAINSISGDEISEFKRWCYMRFSSRYTITLDRCFSAI